MYVHSGGSEEPWHEQYVVRAMHDCAETGGYVILTAHGDVYVETFRSPPHGEVRRGTAAPGCLKDWDRGDGSRSTASTGSSRRTRWPARARGRRA